MTWLPSVDDYFPAEPSRDNDQDASAAAIAVEQGAMSSQEAERLTLRISLKLGTLADTYESVMPLIREAIGRKAHEALGYASIGAYAADRFGDSLTRLGVDTRRDVVRELTAAGMSSRAIAPIVGVSQKTVVKDTQAIPEVSPDATETELIDISVMADASDEEFEVGLKEARAEGDLSRENVVSKINSPVKVTGLDGKQYTRPVPQSEPPKRTIRRRPLGDGFRDVRRDLERLVDRLQRLVDNDRFPQQRDRLADDWAKSLGGQRDRLQSSSS